MESTIPRVHRSLTLVLLFALTSVGLVTMPATAADCGDVSVTPVHGDTFYNNLKNNGVVAGMYVGYEIVNTSTTETLDDLYVTIGGFSDPVVGLATNEDGRLFVGDLAPGDRTVAYFYLASSGTTTTPTTHTVSLHEGPPSLVASFCDTGDGFTAVQQVIQANANKVTTIVSGPNPPEFGGLVTITVSGSTGTVGAAGVFAATPAVYADWPADAYQLLRSEIAYGSDTYVDDLHLTGLPSKSTDYTITYTFAATGTTATPTSISPVTHISSGNEIKHTSLSSIEALPQLGATVNYTTLTKTVDTASLPAVGGQVTYTVTTTNDGGSRDILLADFQDTLDAGLSYVSGTAELDGAPLGDPYVDGQQLLFQGPFTVPANGSIALTYDVLVEGGGGTYDNSVVGNPGSAPVDTTTDTTDLAPGVATVTVGTTGGNGTPTATDETVGTDEDTPLDGTVTATDPDGDTLTATLDTAPTSGTVVVDPDGSYTYTPDDDANGTDSFTVEVCDPSGACDSATITVEVAAVNDAPVGDDVTTTTDEDTATGGNLTATDVDDLTTDLTWSLDTAPTTGTATVAADGTWTYIPDDNTNGPDSFTATVCDDDGLCNTVTIDIDVAAVPDAPVAADETVGTDEDTPVDGTVTATDPDGDTLTATLDTAPTSGTVVVDPDGSYTYTPDDDANGTDSFTVEVCDPSGACDTATITVEVAAVNDAPVGDDVTTTTDEDTATGGNLTATDVDDLTSDLTWSLDTAPTTGTATVAADGTWTYTSDDNTNGPDSFTATVCDDDGLCDTVTIDIDVTAVPDAPVAADASTTTLEDTPVSGSVAAIDVDGDTLTATLATDATSGTVVVDPDGSYTYTPDDDANGTDSFTVEVCDPSGRCDTATITVEVTPVNDTPDGIDLRATTAEDTPLTSSLTATDADGDPVTFTLVSGPSDGTLTLDGDGGFTYEPDADWTGTDSFTVEACDPSGACDTITGSVTVGAVNDAPVAADASVTTPEGTPLVGSVVATDVDGDSLTATLATTPTNGTVVVNADGSYTYAPDDDATGTDSFTIEVCDPSRACDTATITVSVTAVNDAPVGDDVATSTPEDTPTGGTLSATDVDDAASALSWTLTSPATNGTATVASDGTWTYTPDDDANGTDSFTATVCDDDGACDTVTVTAVVTPVNDAPVVADDTVPTDEDTPVSGTVPATDVDGDALSFSLVTAPTSGTLSLAPDGGWTYTPDPDATGSDSFTVEVCDPTGLCDTGTISLDVLPVNDAPDASPVVETTAEDTATGGTLRASDVDDTVLTWSLATAPADGTATVAEDGTWTYKPAPDTSGIDTFAATVCDPSGACDTTTVLVDVLPVNDRPVGEGVTTSTPEDTATGGTLTATDVDDLVGDLVWAIDGAAVNGTATVAPDGTWSYTPDDNTNGADSFTATVCDPDGACDTVLVAVDVTAVNDAPDAAPLTTTTAEDVAVRSTLPGSDVDDKTLTYRITSGPGFGTVLLEADGVFTYTPDENATGTDSFTYEVCDPDGLCDTAIATVIVGEVNDAPEATNTSVGTPEDTPLVGGVTASDVDGDTLSYALTTPPTSGSLALRADGTWTYTPDPDTSGVDSFVVEVCDPAGLCDEATITVDVAAVNDAPSAPAVGVTTDEDAATGGTLPTSDVDDDLAVLTHRLVDAPADGTASVAPDGTWTYVPALDATGTRTFTYEVCDDGALCTTGTVIVDLLPVNDAPVGADDSATTPEDTATSGTLGATDVDDDTSELVHRVLTQPANGTATLTGGSWTYAPDPDTNGIDSFVVETCDPAGLCDEATITVDVAAVNDAPVAIDSTPSTNEDTPLSGTIVVGDADDARGVLTFTVTDAPDSGTLELAPDGTWTYTPNDDSNGTDSFTVLVCDPAGACDPATVTVTVVAQPDVPEADDLVVTTDEDTPATGTVTGTDADGDTLVATLVDGPASGTVTVLPSGDFTYTPSPDTNGTDSFTVELCDPTGRCDTAVVEVEVAPVDDAPVANDLAATILEDTGLTTNLVATDVDSGTLTFGSLSAPAFGTAVLDPDGTLTYTPDADASGTESLTYEVCDPSGLCDTATITIGVGQVNDAPVAVDTLETVDEDAALMSSVVATDPEGDTLTYLDTPPTKGSLELRPDGSYTYTPAPDAFGTDTFTVTVCDPAGLCDDATITVDVTPLPDAPVAEDAAITTPEDTSATGAVAALDVDGESLTYTVLTEPTAGTVELAPGGTWTYTPDADTNGSDSFVIEVCDPTGRCDTSTTVVDVTPVDDAPVVLATRATTPEDTVVSGAVLITERDGDTTVATLANAPTAGTVTVAPDGTWTYTPDADATGTDVFTIQVCDTTTTATTAFTAASALCDTVKVVVDVTPVNDAPVGQDLRLTTVEGTTVTGLLTATDVDGDTLSYEVVEAPAHGTLRVLADGRVTYVPTPGFDGTDRASVRACDPSGACDVLSVVMAIRAAPDDGEAREDVTAGEPFDGSLDLSGVGDDATVRLVSGPRHGTLVLSTSGEYRYTADATHVGSDSFVVEVCGSNGCKSVSVLFTVLQAELPRTGASVAALLALSLLSMGSGLVLVRPRRRRDDTAPGMH